MTPIERGRAATDGIALAGVVLENREPQNPRILKVRLAIIVLDWIMDFAIMSILRLEAPTSLFG